MTQTEFFDLFMRREYRVGCFTKKEHDAFNNDFLATTGLGLDAGHWARFDISFAYLCWSRDGDHICGTGIHYPLGEPISYEEYLRMVEPDVEPTPVSLEGVL